MGAERKRAMTHTRRRPARPARALLAVPCFLLLSFALPPAPAGALDDAPARVQDGAAASGQEAADPAAQELAARILAAVGGEEGWAKARYLAFTFAAGRSHRWDRSTGEHRVAGTTEDGKPFVVLHDLDTREGEAWVDGEALSGDEAAAMLENAYGAWVNDTYWLLVPFKLRDPGVRLEHAGGEEVDGVAYEKLHLSFADVGLTPGDEYWLYVNPESGLIDRWAYQLQGEDPPPVQWVWKEWRRHGPLRLSELRVRVGDGRELGLSDIEVAEAAPAGAFTPAAAPTPPGDRP